MNFLLPFFFLTKQRKISILTVDSYRYHGDRSCSWYFFTPFCNFKIIITQPKSFSMTELVETAVTTSDNTPYGRALKEKYVCETRYRSINRSIFLFDRKKCMIHNNRYFLLAPGYFNLNHGSFGTVPKPVAESQYAKFLEQVSVFKNIFFT